MKIVCAWCQKIIRDDENAKVDDPVSHGICQACKTEIDKELDKIREWNQKEAKDEHRDKRTSGKGK
jgi:hypothetical protein